MKVKRILLIVVAVLLTGNAVFAGGDKNRGDKGQGKVHQVVGP